MMEHIQPAIRARVEEVLDAMRDRSTEEDIKRIEEAFLLAYNAHGSQQRKSGEPYIFHPIAVALIVAKELRLDANCVITAFLHDVVEDTHYTLEDIRLRFGDEVQRLVDVVTKKKKDHYDTTKQVDNFRQLLNSLHYDIRAVLVKIADRLHNMRTLESMTPDKQMKIAGETDYFYAPLANRLGLIEVKTDLENLSFKYRCELTYHDLEQQIQDDAAANEAVLQAFTNRIESLLNREGIEAKVEVYYRRPYSIWRRMQRDKVDYQSVPNRHYIRITYTKCRMPLSEKSACLRIYSILTDYFREQPGSFQNLIDQAKENSYRCLRLMLLSQQGQWEDVQICSRRMVEASKVGCIAEIGNNITKWIERFRTVLLNISKQGHDANLLEQISSSLYYDDVTVFTTNGQSIILPQESTAIDFAFAMDNYIGMHARFCRINGKLSSIKTELKRGDCVEILTDPEAHPADDWLPCIHTYNAHTSVQTWLARQPHSHIKRCPLCHPLPGGELIGIKDEEGHITIHRRNCHQAILLASKYGDNVTEVDLPEDEHTEYPVSLVITAIDRYHLLADLVEHITNVQHLNIAQLSTQMVDGISTIHLTFFVHSVNELSRAKQHIYHIHGVEEVRRE